MLNEHDQSQCHYRQSREDDPESCSHAPLAGEFYCAHRMSCAQGANIVVRADAISIVCLTDKCEVCGTTQRSQVHGQYRLLLTDSSGTLRYVACTLAGVIDGCHWRRITWEQTVCMLHKEPPQAHCRGYGFSA